MPEEENFGEKLLHGLEKVGEVAAEVVVSPFVHMEDNGETTDIQVNIPLDKK